MQMVQIFLMLFSYRIAGGHLLRMKSTSAMWLKMQGKWNILITLSILKFGNAACAVTTREQGISEPVTQLNWVKINDLHF